MLSPTFFYLRLEDCELSCWYCWQ